MLGPSLFHFGLAHGPIVSGPVLLGGFLSSFVFLFSLTRCGMYPITALIYLIEFGLGPLLCGSKKNSKGYQTILMMAGSINMGHDN